MRPVNSVRTGRINEQSFADYVTQTPHEQHSGVIKVYIALLVPVENIFLSRRNLFSFSLIYISLRKTLKPQPKFT